MATSILRIYAAKLLAGSPGGTTTLADQNELKSIMHISKQRQTCICKLNIFLRGSTKLTVCMLTEPRRFKSMASSSATQMLVNVLLLLVVLLLFVLLFGIQRCFYSWKQRMQVMADFFAFCKSIKATSSASCLPSGMSDTCGRISMTSVQWTCRHFSCGASPWSVILPRLANTTQLAPLMHTHRWPCDKLGFLPSSTQTMHARRPSTSSCCCFIMFPVSIPQ